jgi:proprotein convertase subtilisin/kexin type 2
MILSSRPNDEDSHDGFTKWPFMTTHPWAEYPRGKWSLEVKTNSFIVKSYFTALDCQVIL